MGKAGRPRLIAKVYEVDLVDGSWPRSDSGSPLVCPRCGSQMKLIAVITKPAEVGNILRHLLKTGRAPPGLDPSCML